MVEFTKVNSNIINTAIKKYDSADKNIYSGDKFKESLIDPTYTSSLEADAEILAKCRDLYNTNKLGIVYQSSDNSNLTFDTLSNKIYKYRVKVNSAINANTNKQISNVSNIDVFLLMCPLIKTKSNSNNSPNVAKNQTGQYEEPRGLNQRGEYFEPREEPEDAGYEEPRKGNGNGGYMTVENAGFRDRSPTITKLAELPAPKTTPIINPT